jgi:acetyltransferase-like isoleucine patch superfamily enzyme
MRSFLTLLAVVMPWRLKRVVYGLLGHDLHPDARVGLSLILVDRLQMRAGARVGHFNVIRQCDLVRLDEDAAIGSFNLITGSGPDRRFLDDGDRRPSLELEEGAAVTFGHYIDTSDNVRFGRFSGLGGWGSQVLTHRVASGAGAHESHPVSFGDHSRCATSVIVLPGASLPDRSVLAANSVLAGAREEAGTLYAGSPAEPVRTYSTDIPLLAGAVAEIA